jgi:trehalose-phosphatase
MLFDYDGTLTPIVDHPALARLEAPTLQVLRRLVTHPGISVGVVSGRALDDLWELMDVPGIYYAGTSGLEFDLQGQRFTVPEAEPYRTLIKDVAAQLSILTMEFSDAWVENKELGLTLHYRRVAHEHCAELLKKASRILHPYSEQLRLTEGPMAWELTPRICWDKGSALRLILESIGSPVLPFYAGDAANDEEAIATALELGGVALAIGNNVATCLENRLNDPSALTDFLLCFEESLATASTSEASRSAPWMESLLAYGVAKA